jgi:hypothetical protein
VHLRSGFILAESVERKLALWVGLLAALAATNIGLWIWIGTSAGRTPGSHRGASA